MKEVQNLLKMTVYRNLLKDEIIKKYMHLLTEFERKAEKIDVAELYYELIFRLNHIEEAIELQGNRLKSYIFRRVVEDKNIFTLACEQGRVDTQNLIYKQGIKDLKSIKTIVDYDFSEIKKYLNDKTDYFSMEKLENYSELIKTETIFITNNNLDKTTDSLVNYYKSQGYGKIGFYNVFNWKNSDLHGVKNFDDISMDNLYRYDYQRNILIKNTRAFIEGKPANNVLLVGARGTGKSSSVKALINHFENTDLKLIEIFKDQLEQLSDILNILKDRNKKFIIYIDDLSFEENETNYKHLKSIIEGGVEKRPNNILLYATSNRRHLIRETWADRDTNDIHGNDTVNEKLSLSDRFGITITFQAPNQDEYLAIVKGIGEKCGIAIEDKEFFEAAKRWAISQNGRSGRTAKQFVENYLGQE